MLIILVDTGIMKKKRSYLAFEGWTFNRRDRDMNKQIQ